MQHKGAAVAEDLPVSGGQEYAQVRAPAVDVGEHRAQAGGEADPATPAEHAGVGAQGIAAEDGRAGCIEALAVGGVRVPFPLGQVLLLAAAAVGGGQQGPVVGGDLQGWLQ